MNVRVKIAAFQNTSSEKIIESFDFKKILMPGDKIKDSELIRKELDDADILIMFGQKPVVKNKIYVEMLAKMDGKEIETNFDAEKIITAFEENNLSVLKSKNPGNSYCNLVYWNSLNYVNQLESGCRVLFIHIPFEKNIQDIMDFSGKIYRAVCDYVKAFL